MPHRQPPRQPLPELEREYARAPSLGYEAPEELRLVCCLEHGYPTPLARWHHHDEYELHLIVATHGKAFVGDWIGPFEPGHLVLTGPRLPHNWISVDLGPEGVPVRDLVIQFKHEPLLAAAEHIPELLGLRPLLERARFGLEFFGLGARAEAHWRRVKSQSGVRRIAAFTDYLADLVECRDYRVLSTVEMRATESDQALVPINDIIDRLMADLTAAPPAAEMAASLGLSESNFSRYFKRATGNTYTDFVNRLRINRACQLLMDSHRLVSHVSWDVGFRNLANFNRRFLEMKGMTPREFRRQALGRFGDEVAETA